MVQNSHGFQTSSPLYSGNGIGATIIEREKRGRESFFARQRPWVNAELRKTTPDPLPTPFIPSETRKPFDVLAEGLASENSRDDKTSIELFLAGIRGWESLLQKRLDDGKPRKS
jgi:hypothetical protein